MSLSATLLMIPDWQALLVILAAVVGPSIIGFVIVQRLVPVSVRLAHNEVAGFVFSVVGVMYGVLLAFVVIVVWEQYSESRVNTRHESSAVVSLQHAMGAYADASDSPDLRPALLGYLHEIVAGEFPVMAAQRRLPPVSQALEAIWQGVQGLSPTSLRQQVLYGELIGKLNELERLRAERLGDAHEELPHVIWLALIAGAVLTIGFAFFLGTENVSAHGVMIAVLGALVGVVFYVIVELDHPFSGAVSIGAEGFQDIIEMIEAP
jgi:hypothetical protein